MVIESVAVKSSNSLEELVIVTNPSNDDRTTNVEILNKHDSITYDRHDDEHQQEQCLTSENLPKTSSDAVTAEDEELKTVFCYNFHCYDV